MTGVLAKYKESFLHYGGNGGWVVTKKPGAFSYRGGGGSGEGVGAGYCRAHHSCIA